VVKLGFVLWLPKLKVFNHKFTSVDNEHYVHNYVMKSNKDLFYTTFCFFLTLKLLWKASYSVKVNAQS